MPAPESFFDLFRDRGEFVRDYEAIAKPWTDQIRQSRVFYIAGYPELAQRRPHMSNDDVRGHFNSGRALLAGWEGDVGGAFKAMGSDQPGYARESQPVTPENAALLIRCAEAYKTAEANGAGKVDDIYASIRIESCVYVLAGFRETDFKKVPGQAMREFRARASRILDFRYDVQMSFVEADLAEGYGVPRDLADLAVELLGPHCNGMYRTVLRRGVGNTAGASLNLRFRPGSPAIQIPNEGPPLQRVTSSGQFRRKLRAGAKLGDGSRPLSTPFSHSEQFN